MTNISDVSQHPFCLFSDQVYADTKAGELLHDLQKRLGFNPNMVLFCCWFAKTGQRQLTQKNMRHILAEILPWHEQIVLALKKLRRKLPPHKIKDLLITTEDNANHLEQVMLTEAIVKTRHTRSALQQFADAYKNINTYDKVMQATITQEDSNLITNLLTIIFHTVIPKNKHPHWLEA